MSINKSVLFCESVFWNETLSWSSEWPQLTQCFSQTVLPVIPLIGLLTILPYDFYIIRKYCKNFHPIPYQWKNILNLINIFILITIQILYLSDTLWKHFKQIETKTLIISELFSPTIKLISYSLVLIFVLIFRKSGQTHPNSIPVHWFCTLLISSIDLYQNLIKDYSEDNNLIHYLLDVLKYLEIFFISIAFIISCLTQNTSQFVALATGDSPVCPMTKFNVFSRIFYLWIYRLLKYGCRRNVDLTQYLLPVCWYQRANNSVKDYERTDRKYNSRRPVAKMRLLPLIASVAFSPYLCGSILVFGEIGSNFIQPIFLSKLMDFISGVDPIQWHGIYFGIFFCVLNILVRLFDCHSFMYFLLVQYRVRTALTTAVFKKMLKLSADSRRKYTTGDINNLMAIDIQEISSFFQKSSNLFSIPISVGIGTYIMWQYLGPSSLTFLVVMTTISPVTILFMKPIRNIQTIQIKLKDKRMEQLFEILNNIRLLKLFGWEMPFIARITQTRAQELNKQIHFNCLLSFVQVCYIVLPVLTIGLTFTVFILVSNSPLTAKTAFVSFYVMCLLRGPLNNFPNVLTHLVRAVVSFKRIKKYLRSEELEPNPEENVFSDLDINLKNCSFAWNSTDEPILRDINLSVKKGTLVAIVGKVGAGKSSIFSALLGDMHQISGDKSIGSISVSYVPQTVWIQNTTLQKNIKFMSHYVPEKYEQIVEACALKHDFDLLPEQDMTEIGENGINLSGGQKHRISLARAVYHESDIYLLDDPLSAMDAHVAQHLFQQVIGPNGLLKGKTRLLATNNLLFLKDCDLIVVMSAGKIIGTGSYEELYKNGFLSKQLLKESDDISSGSEDSSQERITEAEDNPETFRHKLEKEVKRGLLIDEGQPHFGKIGCKLYFDYISRCGIFFTIIPFLTDIASNSCEVVNSYYLNMWSSQNTTKIEDPTNKWTFLSIYMALIFGNALSFTTTNIIFRCGSVKAGANLHKNMLQSVIRAPLLFFNTTPLGRIINRFIKDINQIDNEIPLCVMTSLHSFVWFTIISGFIIYMNPLMIIQTIIVIIILLILYRFYISTSRQLYRLDSITRSSVLSHFNESMAGAVSIRAYKVQDVFVDRLQSLLDRSININKHIILTVNWIQLWSTIIGTIISLSTAIMVVLNANYMTAGFAAFILIYSVEMVNSFSLALRSTARLENSMVSVERVKEYSELESEADWNSTENLRPAAYWPTTGKIEFFNYSTRYRPELDLVLKDLNFKINSGEKVGIVGRTGAGKSSLTLALFRIIEPVFGRIIIDEVDISRIGLHDLRTRITIIPQEPNLFAGTLRFNLDPLNQYNDQMLWSSLESAHLRDFFINTSDGLSYEITEGGENLSACQRQLICLARALLRKTKILVLDEATAACDLVTDQLIQMTIREKFNDCTVLTIAHRLDTVFDYNKIIVLDNGQVVEMDSPKNLLKDTDSLFYSLAKEFRISWKRGRSNSCCMAS